jgi:hypothetical protein
MNHVIIHRRILSVSIWQPAVLHEDDVDPGNPGVSRGDAAAPNACSRFRDLPVLSFR